MEQLPIRASWYDPQLGGINCYLDTCDHLGDGTPVATSYGWAMACPAGMYGLTLEIEHAGQWTCRDHGGAVVPKYGRVFDGSQVVDTWYLTGDFLLQEPAAWSYMLLDWSVVE